MRILNRFSWLQWLLFGVIILITAGVFGVGFGYLDGENELRESTSISIASDIQKQFTLGMGDFESGNYELARQRFEYVLQRDPEYPDGVKMLTDTIMQQELQLQKILQQESQPKISEIQVTSTQIPSITPTPTPDTREIDELSVVVQDQLNNKDWKNLISTILALRNINPLYKVSEIDSALYLALYFGGIDKIMLDGDLEGGLYDLALAEQFAPLDSSAQVYQGWARMYQMGMSFWGVYPDQSIYYFSQLAYAAPYLKDLSGIPATNRYRMAVIQYAEQFAKAEEWCDSYEQYQLAQNLYEDQGLKPTVNDIYERCQISIATYTPSPTNTLTPTITNTSTIAPPTDDGFTLTPQNTSTHTPTPELTTPPASNTPTQTPEDTSTQESTSTFTPEATATSTPTPDEPTQTETPTEEPTLEPSSTETPTATPDSG
jgi:hypothetical protein